MVDHVTAASRLRRAAQSETTNPQAVPPVVRQKPDDMKANAPTTGMAQMSISAQPTPKAVR
jgi:hypothetical protein